MTSFYFPHDYNAANDAKILFLRHQLGMEGYGIFWFVVEQLAQAGGRLPLSIIPVLAMQCQAQEAKVRAVVEGYGLFTIESEIFYSNRLNKHLEIRKKIKESGKRGAIVRWGNLNGGGNSHPIGEGIAPLNGGANGDPNAKEKKRKEKKENKIKEIDCDRTKTFPIEQCLEMSVNHFSRWMRANNTNREELSLFNQYLEKLSKFEMNPQDYREYFAKLKGKYPHLLKKEYSLEELREIAKKMNYGQPGI